MLIRVLIYQNIFQTKISTTVGNFRKAEEMSTLPLYIVLWKSYGKFIYVILGATIESGQTWEQTHLILMTRTEQFDSNSV